MAPCAENAVAVICGPPIMIKYTLPVFFNLNFSKRLHGKAAQFPS